MNESSFPPSPPGYRLTTLATPSVVENATDRLDLSHVSVAVLGLLIGAVCTLLIVGLLVVSHRAEHSPSVNLTPTASPLAAPDAPGTTGRRPPSQGNHADRPRPGAERYAPPLAPPETDDAGAEAYSPDPSPTQTDQLARLLAEYPRPVNEHVLASLSAAQKALYFWVISQLEQQPSEDCP